MKSVRLCSSPNATGGEELYTNGCWWLRRLVMSPSFLPLWSFEATRDSCITPSTLNHLEGRHRPETDLVPRHRDEPGGGGAWARQGDVLVAVCCLFVLAVGNMKQQQQLRREDTKAHNNSKIWHSLDTEKERLVANTLATKAKARLTFRRVTGMMRACHVPLHTSPL